MSLFSGIGGLDLSAEWAGFITVGQIEKDEYCTSILKKHWGDIPRWGDIAYVKGQEVLEKCGKITLLSGGFPCQAVSSAGCRKGDSDERWMWGEMYRLICEVKPKWVVGENVKGLLSMQSVSGGGSLFGGILRDLDKAGYNVGWLCYGAKDLGSPQGRERIFIVGYSKYHGLDGEEVRGSNQETGNNNQEGEKETFQFKGASGSSGFEDLQGRKWYEREWISGGRGFIESQMGRIFDGVPRWVGKWVAKPEEPQYEWEPPRVAPEMENRKQMLRVLGNSVCPVQAFPIFRSIADMIEQGY